MLLIISIENCELKCQYIVSERLAERVENVLNRGV